MIPFLGCLRVAFGLLVAIGVPASPDDGPPFVPPKDFAEHGNAVYRTRFLLNASGADLGAVHDTFAKGNWNAFSTWSAALAAGKLDVQAARATASAESPHARFLHALLTAPAAERAAFLGWLPQARRAHHGLNDPLAVPALSPCIGACRAWLAAYLSHFLAPPWSRPAWAANPRAPLGRRILYYSHAPEPLLVGLAGDLAITEALPTLMAVLAMPRRFHTLHTDTPYPTTEMSPLFVQALWAAVKIARADRAARFAFETFLADALAEGARNAPETILLERHTDRGGARVDLRTLEGEGVQTRADWLRLARAAIAAPPKARAALAGAKWSRSFLPVPKHDEHVRVGDDLLLATGVLSIASGDFVAFDDAVAGETFTTPTIVRAAAAAASSLFVIWSGQDGGRQRLFVAEVGTDGMRGLTPLSGSVSDTAWVRFFAPLSSGYCLIVDRVLRIYDREGREQRHDAVADDVAVGVSANTVVLYNSDQSLTLIAHPWQKRTPHTPLAALLGGQATDGFPGSPPIVTPELAIVLDAQGTLFAVAHADVVARGGRPRWAAAVNGTRAEDPLRTGDQLLLRTYDALAVVALTGRIEARVAMPKDVREMVSDGAAAYVLRENGVLERYLLPSGAKTTYVNRQLSANAGLIACSEKDVLVHFLDASLHQHIALVLASAFHQGP